MTIFTHVGFSKGGVKKTTTTIGLALRLAELDNNVLVVDLDSQCDASRMLGVNYKDAGCSTADLYSESPIVTPVKVNSWLWRGSKEGVGSISVIPANQGKLADIAKNSDLTLIKNFMQNSRKIGGDFDFVIFDTPPSLDINQVAGLSACDFTILPLSCDFNNCGSEKVQEYLKVVKTVKKNFNQNLGSPIVILTDVDLKGNLTKRYVEWANNFFGSAKVDGFVEHSTAIPNAFDKLVKKAVWFRPSSGNDRVKGNAFKSFLDNIIAKLSK